MPDRQCILHIGVAKTGSSSLQGWFSGNRAAFAAKGVHYVKSLGERNHLRILLLAGGRIPRPVRRSNSTRGPVEAEFTEELRGLPPDIHTVVISSEGLGTIKSKEEVAALRSFLEPHFARFRVIAYLRRQDEQRVSLLSTKYKTGVAVNRPLGRSIEDQTFWKRAFDYDRMLDIWAEMFGEAAVTPRIFQREDLAGGDVRSDFAGLLGIEGVPLTATKGEKSNPSILPEAQEFLRLLNEAKKADETEFEKGRYRRLLRALEERFQGSGALPDRATAMALMKKSRASNERVRQRWFPERATLFKEDFSRYPEVAAKTDQERVLGVALHAASILLRPKSEGLATPEPARRRGEKARRRIAA
jgi:hypothetical protein